MRVGLPRIIYQKKRAGTISAPLSRKKEDYRYAASISRVNAAAAIGAHDLATHALILPFKRARQQYWVQGFGTVKCRLI